MKKEPKTTNEEPTNPITVATAAAVIEKQAEHLAAVATFDEGRKQNQALAGELAQLFRKTNDSPDFLDKRYPIEARIGQLQIDLPKWEYAVRLASHHWSVASLADRAARGEPDAMILTGIVDRLRELADQVQSAGDPAGPLTAARQVYREYEAAFQREADKCEKANEPPPPRIDPPRAFRALLAIARAEKANVPITAADVAFAARGDMIGQIDPGLTVADAVALFTQPHTPILSRGHSDRAERDLRELHTRAFDISEERKKLAEEEARARREGEAARQRAREQDERRAEERRREQEKASAAARARNVKLEAFVRQTEGKRRML